MGVQTVSRFFTAQAVAVVHGLNCGDRRSGHKKRKLDLTLNLSPNL